LAELAEKPVPEMLKNLERADVSGFARICALSSLLSPGYVVVLLNYAGTQSIAGTPHPTRGTPVSAKVAAPMPGS
jgi:hypothetical protein